MYSMASVSDHESASTSLRQACVAESMGTVDRILRKREGEARLADCNLLRQADRYSDVQADDLQVAQATRLVLSEGHVLGRVSHVRISQHFHRWESNPSSNYKPIRRYVLRTKSVSGWPPYPVCVRIVGHEAWHPAHRGSRVVVRACTTQVHHNLIDPASPRPRGRGKRYCRC